MVRVLCAGHVNWDVTLKVDSLPDDDGEATILQQVQASGGSAANTAAVLAGLDVDATLLGSVGDDENGFLARRELSEAGVDCTHLRVDEGETTVKYLVVDAAGEVFVLGNEGANEAFGTGDVAAADIERQDFLHLTGQRPETAENLAATAGEMAVPVGFDPGRRIDDREYGSVLRYVDVLFVNEREADALAQEGGVDRSETLLVVKRGSDGAAVRTPDGSVTHPGFDVDVVDTTGAGDAFAGGFIASWVAHGDLETALSVANACGALAASQMGARVDVSRDEVDALLGR
jgi:ribokinase